MCGEAVNVNAGFSYKSVYIFLFVATVASCRELTEVITAQPHASKPLLFTTEDGVFRQSCSFKGCLRTLLFLLPLGEVVLSPTLHWPSNEIGVEKGKLCELCVAHTSTEPSSNQAQKVPLSYTYPDYRFDVPSLTVQLTSHETCEGSSAVWTLNEMESFYDEWSKRYSQGIVSRSMFRAQVTGNNIYYTT